jgi:endonuclease/exonuclease/phosphatase family metal-dependent hydrolase
MYRCEDRMHDAAAFLGSESALDAIIAGGSNELPPVVNVQVFNNGIYDHSPIQCQVHGVTLFSWNLEGLCDQNYDPASHDERWLRMTAFIQQLNPFPDVFCFQELFLRSNMPVLADRKNKAFQNMELMLGPQKDDFIYVYDDFTGGTLVRKKYAQSPAVVVDVGADLPEDKEKEKEEEDLEMKQIARYNDQNKKCTVVRVFYAPNQSFYVVNVHLKAVQMSYNGRAIHRKEVANLLAHLTAEMETGVVFMGDHNTVDSETIYTAGRRRPRRKTARKKSASRRRPKKYAVM